MLFLSTTEAYIYHWIQRAETFDISKMKSPFNRKQDTKSNSHVIHKCEFNSRNQITTKRVKFTKVLLKANILLYLKNKERKKA